MCTCKHTYDTQAHTYTWLKSITYVKEKRARAKLLKEAFEARSDDVWKTFHKSLFKQRTSTQGWNKSENKGNESSPYSLCVHRLLLHRKETSGIYWISESKVGLAKPEHRWIKLTLIFNEFFCVKHNCMILIEGP